MAKDIIREDEVVVITVASSVQTITPCEGVNLLNVIVFDSDNFMFKETVVVHFVIKGGGTKVSGNLIYCHGVQVQETARRLNELKLNKGLVVKALGGIAVWLGVDQLTIGSVSIGNEDSGVFTVYCF